MDLKITNEEERNPHTLSTEELFDRLMQANEEEGWRLSNKSIGETYEKLQDFQSEAYGRFIFLSLQVCFGEGDTGVAETFEKHLARIKRVYDKSFWRAKHLMSGKCSYGTSNVERPRLRLLVGNHTHRPVINPIMIDMNTYSQPKLINDARGIHSLADELFTFAWLYPEYIKNTNDGENLWIVAGGYELNVPECSGEDWEYIPYIHHCKRNNRTFLSLDEHHHLYSNLSMPTRQE